MNTIINLFSSDINIGDKCTLELLTGRIISGKILDINDSVLIELTDGRKVRVLASILGAWEIIPPNNQNKEQPIRNKADNCEQYKKHGLHESGISSIGLVAVAAPDNEKSDFPSFFPFPHSKSVIYVGANSDISLDKWDFKEKKKGLYLKHVLFEYHPSPISQWTIRSMHGVRRGSKAVIVNGTDIASHNGSVLINSGDIIILGGFSFEFRSNRKEELLNYESPEILIKYTELLLKSQVEKFSKEDIPNHLFSPSKIPRPINVKSNSDGTTTWLLAFIGDYGEMLAANWDSPLMTGYRKQFLSKELFKSDMKRIRPIRNMLDHPKALNASINDDDRQFLADLYYKLLIASSMDDPLISYK